MNGYAVLLMSGRHLVYCKRFKPNEITTAVRIYSLLQEGEMGKEAQVIFTNDLELPDILLTQNAELDFNPLAR
jgi:hypothetical protein